MKNEGIFMLKNNCTKFNIKNILAIFFILVLSFFVGAFLNKTTTLVMANRDVEVKEKQIEPENVDILVAQATDLDFEIKPATLREKIASRASSARRTQCEEENYISIDEVSISIDMDLSVTTGLSKEDFVDLISNCSADTSGFFEENADLIYDLCQIYSINEIFFCGLISAESGWNIAQNHRNTYNYISLMSGGGLLRFSSVEDGLESAAIALHNNYLTPGGKFYRGSTLEGVRTIFCSENPGWTSLVYGRMRQII